ncbi:YbaB/EbfC family nucleoid-associated protein [Actinomadura graeca]|uniref:YbaB/EbfC family nucleoid-associated protein n=1 Tax=Actinomadura graeca TaxID=2750812 RepID=A0ABX8R055_9ACTN|nr:YbaB/EbfC family nucleoid-associated protein [Actinomadura graeca]QXJ23951.1 YbaB/EbfC family nucleoid-associated protein [Actinomadura graeca]
MTADFGEFANINVDEVLRRAQDQAARVAALQKELADTAGHAESEDGHVKVSYTSTGGITELEINPRAMRMASADLADTIKRVVQEAANDLQANIRAKMAAVFEGQEDDPLAIIDDPSKITAKISDMQGLMESAMGDASLHMEKMRRRMGL